MRVARYIGIVGLGLGLAGLCAVSGASAAGAGLSSYQGAWLGDSLQCGAVYSNGGKGAAFKKPVNIFAPAFVISGNRLRTPQATCRIKSLKPTSDRQIVSLYCANSVAAHDVTVQMAASPDGTLKRFFNDQDKTGSTYQRCSR